jgi:hypothetical protein
MLAGLLLLGCSTEPVVKSIDEVDFTDLSGHWTDSHVYELGRVFEDVDIVLAFKAAKAGLLSADFEIVESDNSQHFVSGKRDGASFTEFFLWEPVPNAAGVSLYLKKVEADVLVKVAYKGQVFTRTSTGDGYKKNRAIHQDINKIFSGMEAFFMDERIRLQKERREKESEG